MARKRAPGGGRKPRGVGPAVHFNTRIAPDVRRRLERDARRNGRSLSHEIEVRLTDSIREAPAADVQTRALCYLISQVAEIGRVVGLERSSGSEFNWRTNRFDFEAFRAAIAHLLDRLAPTGEIEASRYPLFETSEAMGRSIGSHAMAYLSSSDSLLKRAEGRGAPTGSLLYAFPQAARDLGFKTRQGE
jgi:TraY domain